MIDYLLDALLDTLKLVPWLLVMHVLIEVFEYHAVSKIKLNKALRSPFAPLIGGVCGILPQCGFGVVAADLYSRRSIRLGTMIAVFIATSDEAIPIMLSAPTADSVIRLVILLGFKLAAALVAGYFLNFILRKRELTAIDDTVVVRGCHHHELGEHTHEHDHGHDHEEHKEKAAYDAAADESAEAYEAEDRGEETSHAETKGMQVHESGSPTADAKKKRFDFKCFVLHPLLHTLTVAGYILAVNVVFAVVLYFVGEARLVSFLEQARFFQPLLAGLVGLIPNCASSVIIAQMFSVGTLTLGAAFAGLSVNAGLGLAVLLRKNRPFSSNILIAAGLYGYSVIVGTLLTLLPI